MRVQAGRAPRSGRLRGQRRPDAASPGPPPRWRPRVPGLPERLSPALSVVVRAGSGVWGECRGGWWLGGEIASGGLGREGEGAAEDRRSRRRAVGAGSRAGRGESCWRRGGGAEPEEGDAERACLAPGGPANVTVSLADRSQQLTLRLTRTLAPKPAPPRDRGVPAIVRRTPRPVPPGGYLQLPSA